MRTLYGRAMCAKAYACNTRAYAFVRHKGFNWLFFLTIGEERRDHGSVYVYTNVRANIVCGCVSVQLIKGRRTLLCAYVCVCVVGAARMLVDPYLGIEIMIVDNADDPRTPIDKTKFNNLYHYL